MKTLLGTLLLLSALCFRGYGQTPKVYKFVNAANLNLREYPKDDAAVFVVLHAPAKVRVYDPPTDDYYKNNKAIMAKWVEVGCQQPASTPDGMSKSWGGWVQRKYLVADSTAVTAPKSDTPITDNMAALGRAPGINTGGGTGRAAAGRVYHRGPRGGCFYYSASGAKVYVSRSLCN